MSVARRSRVVVRSVGLRIRRSSSFVANAERPWWGKFQVPSFKFQVPSPLAPSTQSPANYTPKHLAERILAEQAAMEARGMPDGERKTITALFADIKDSTALIEDLDPEEARRIIDPALKL